MYTSAFVAALHFLGVGFGFAGVWIRGRGLAARDLRTIFYGDNVWGIAALLLWSSGPLRAFGGYEKGTAFYVNQPMFWVKMGLVGLAGLLELWPMYTFVRWRIREKRGLPIDLAPVPWLARINAVELVLISLVPFAAVAMARGIRF